MRRMITDNQLNNLKAANLKIIELDTSITNATITKEQMDIMFPKDAQGNIHKPDYDIIISDTTTTSGSFYYLSFWTPTKIRFNRFGTDAYYTATIGPNDTKFIHNPTAVRTYFLHHIYIKTSELYIFLTIATSNNNTYNINRVRDHIKDFHASCSGYLTQGSQGPITSLCYKSTDNKFYYSLGAEGKDYAFFQESDVTECIDEVIGISVN